MWVFIWFSPPLSYSLYKKPCRLRLSALNHYVFAANIIISVWNLLPNRVVTAAFVNSFKKRFDDRVTAMTTHKAPLHICVYNYQQVQPCKRSNWYFDRYVPYENVLLRSHGNQRETTRKRGILVGFRHPHRNSVGVHCCIIESNGC